MSKYFAGLRVLSRLLPNVNWINVVCCLLLFTLYRKFFSWQVQPRQAAATAGASLLPLLHIFLLTNCAPKADLRKSSSSSSGWKNKHRYRERENTSRQRDWWMELRRGKQMGNCDVNIQNWYAQLHVLPPHRWTNSQPELFRKGRKSGSGKTEVGRRRMFFFPQPLQPRWLQVFPPSTLFHHTVHQIPTKLLRRIYKTEHSLAT